MDQDGACCDLLAGMQHNGSLLSGRWSRYNTEATEYSSRPNGFGAGDDQCRKTGIIANPIKIYDEFSACW